METHIWFAEIGDIRGQLDSFRRLLDEDELRRADRFKFEKDRIRYACAHGMLRRILSSYCECPPHSIRFVTGEHGKPYMPDSDLYFNESDSGDMVLVGVARGRELGIDIEQIRTGIQPEDIADRFFSPTEVEALMSLPADQRETAFFRIWTRKEAYIKATGEGLFHGLETFDVSLEVGCQNALRATRPDPAEASRWIMADLTIDPDYASAICIAPPLGEVTIRRWNQAT